VPCLTPELNKRLETIQEKFNRMEKMIQDLKKTAS
jgi:archaellum component FlaC